MLLARKFLKRLKPKFPNIPVFLQDDETGGFSDRPGDMPDPFHTLFGVAGLSLLGVPDLKCVNPTYCMPQHVIDRMQIFPQKLTRGG